MDLTEDQKKLLKRVMDGTARVDHIGSVRASEDARPENVVTALETAIQAQQSSDHARYLLSNGDLAGASALLCQSVILEESIGNYWGIASDLGNLAEIFRHVGSVGEAEAMFIWLRDFVRELIEQMTRTENASDDHDKELADYYLLLGLHTEGLIRAYISVGRDLEASKLADEMLVSYHRSGSKEHSSQARGLADYLAK